MITINCTERVTSDLEAKKSHKGTDCIKVRLAVNKGFVDKQKIFEKAL